MIRKVNAVVIFVDDLETVMQFYRDKVGVQVLGGDDVSYYLRLEGQDFALVKVSAGIRMMDEATFAGGAGSRIMLCADVEDIDGKYAALTAKGVKFIKPPIDQPWGFRTAYFADPQGSVWEFRQTIPAAP